MNNLVITIFTLAVVVLPHNIQGGLIEKRAKREIYPEVEPEKVEDAQPQVCVVGDLVYGADEPVPADQPCLRCRCQPPGVHCEATRCEKKPGCRAIHKPNTCCPDYQCECEHEGKTYGNGERLEQKPGTECKVCYCRGGEVQCAEVSCYMRDDCEGRKVPGKCCPKYDHCPPKEPILDRPSYTMEPLNVTTKEPTTLSENEINDTERPSEKETHSHGEIQKITIHEIIPEIKEIPITNSPKREVKDSVQGQLIVEEATKGESTKNEAPSEAHEASKASTQAAFTEGENELDLPDADSESSEVAEIYQPPPVLRIGDKLLFLKKGELVPEKDASTPATVITIIGAEGLQRGFEDSVENHENKTLEDDLEPTHDDVNVAESTREVILETTQVTSTTEGEDGNSSIEIAVELPEVNQTEIIVTSPPTKTTEEVQDNPEYPPIPDIMSRSDDDHLEMELQPPNSKRETEAEPKILQEVLGIRSNKTVPNNQSNAEWLKHTLINENATLPDSILTQEAESDSTESTTVKIQAKSSEAIEKFGTTIPYYTQNHIKALAQEETIDIASNPTKLIETDPTIAFSSPTISDPTIEALDPTKSIETLEETSGESVTPINMQSSQSEDASVESTDMSDLVEFLPGMDRTEERAIEPVSTTENSDAEVIDTSLLSSNVTHEEDEMTHPTKIVGKRENDESDSIFEELDREIGLVSGTIKDERSHEEEQKEAETIFKELLDESQGKTTDKPLDLQPKDRESAVLQRVSDAISKFQLRDTKQSLDSSILGILRDFFSSQYRAYNKK